MNAIFYVIVLLSVLFAALTGTPADVGKAALDSAKSAVDLAIGLVGAISLFLGLMAVVEAAGGLDWMARLIRPVLVRLFPDVPADHPAMGAMVMNISANMLGLGNAATPFGLKAMKELDSLNDDKGTATDAMVLFLVINTSGLAMLPTGVIAIRALNGSKDAAAIFPTTLMAHSTGSLVGITTALLLAALFPRKGAAATLGEALGRALRTVGFVLLMVAAGVALAGLGAGLARLVQPWAGGFAAPIAIAAVLGIGLAVRRVLSEPARELLNVVLFGAGLLGLVAVVYAFGDAASAWILPGLILGMLTVGVARKVKIYEVFIKGAKEGFTMALTIIPYLVAILAAVGMLRASGGLDRIVGVLSPITGPLGLPGEVLPLALLRPLTGSGAFAITTDLIKTYGPDTYVGQLASTLNGSMETTFYVLAVYFGSVGVTRMRHAVPSGLIADCSGIIGSVIAVRLLLGGP